MKTLAFAFAALLGLGLNTTVSAQTVPVTPGTTITPGAGAPGQVGTTSGTVPNGAMNGTMATPGATTAGAVPNSTINGGLTTPAGTTPVGTTPGTVYSPGTTTVPNATLDATRPAGTSPVTPGATRRTTTGSRTTTKTVRP